jgi:hypothetical protein
MASRTGIWGQKSAAAGLNSRIALAHPPRSSSLLQVPTASHPCNRGQPISSRQRHIRLKNRIHVHYNVPFVASSPTTLMGPWNV